MDYKIYGLYEIGIDEIRYIGLTKNKLQNRLYDHINKRFIRNNHKNNWIQNVYNRGSNISYKLIEDGLTKEEASLKEIYYISILLNLTNGTSGGESGFSHSEETRKKISEAGKGNKNHHIPHTEKGKKNISNSKKGKKSKRIYQPHTEETKERIRKKKMGSTTKKKGTKLSEQARENIRQSLLGRMNGRIWINNLDSNKIIKPEELSFYLNQGWFTGMKKKNYAEAEYSDFKTQQIINGI